MILRYLLNSVYHKLIFQDFKIKQNQLITKRGSTRLTLQNGFNLAKKVDYGFLKIRIDELGNHVYNYFTKIKSFNEYRTNFNHSVKNKILDKKKKLDLLAATKKILTEENCTSKTNLSNIFDQINAAKVHYHRALQLIGKNENGSLVTSTQIKIEAVQEQQRLFQEGNDINENILKLEKNVKKLEKGLCLFNGLNFTYRENSLCKKGKSSYF